MERFTSWSLYEDVADRQYNGRGNDVILKMLVKEPLIGMDIQGYSNFPEGEILLAPGLRLKVLERVNDVLLVEPFY